jgi:hypothetical protein
VGEIGTNKPSNPGNQIERHTDEGNKIQRRNRVRYRLKRP